jgi:hypothetical protein
MKVRRAAAAAVVVLAVAAAVLGGTSAQASQSREAAHGPVPGVLGVDHFGITVPDVAQARDWFVNVLGCVAPLQFGPFFDPSGSLMTRLVGVHPRAVIEQIVSSTPPRGRSGPSRRTRTSRATTSPST